MSTVFVIAGYALRESLRRRVFLVVLLLTLVFLALYALGAWQVFEEVEQGFPGADIVEEREIAGSTIFGLAMFATLFLGVVLAVFLTLGAVRGDAERGLLQPLVVRPVGRAALLGGRFVAAAGVCSGYVVGVYLLASVITNAAGGWWPDRVVTPAIELALAVVVVAAISLLGSIFLSATANGIAVFMMFGAGLTAGLLGQIGSALGSDTLGDVADVTSWLLPFEALYQDALDSITADASGPTAVVVELGPFGGAQGAGPLLWLWALAYLVLIAGAAVAAFNRRDL